MTDLGHRARGDDTLRAVVLSEPGSGGTTFVGLLYLALTRLSTERADTFRFSAPSESIRHLSSLYAQLVAGDPPGPLGPGEASQIRLELAYGSSPTWRPFRRTSGFDPRSRAACRWIRSGFDDAAHALEGGPADPGTVGDLLACTTPVFVLDGTVPVPSPATGPGAGATRDSAMVRILKELARGAGPAVSTTPKRVHPLVVFTKIDALPENVSPGKPRGNLLDEDGLAADGMKLGRDLIDARVPETVAFCRSAAGRVDEPVPFLSFVRPAPGPDPATRRLLTRTLPDHRHEPVYPFGQFRALVDQLGALAGPGP